jgi:hypothetical protein
MKKYLQKAAVLLLATTCAMLTSVAYSQQSSASKYSNDDDENTSTQTSDKDAKLKLDAEFAAFKKSEELERVKLEKLYAEKIAASEESWKKYLASVLDYIVKIDKKGKDVADASKTKYKSISVKDEMSGVVKTKAIAEGVIGKGTYKIETYCSGNNLSASISIFDVEVPTSLKGTVQGRMRIDGKVSPFTFDTDPKWRNVIPVVIGSANNSRLSEMDYYTLNTSNNWVKLNLYTSQTFLNDDLATSKCEANCPDTIIVKRSYGGTSSDVALEIPTSSGNIFIEIPPYDPAIRKVLASCPELSKPEKFGHLKGDKMYKAIYK